VIAGDTRRHQRGPKSLDEMRAARAEQRRQLQRAPQVPLHLTSISSTPPAPGTLAFMEKQRQELRDARDLRITARGQVDRVWTEAQNWVLVQHGRRVSLNALDQRGPEAEYALRAAQRAGEAYIGVSLTAASRATREQMLDAFCSATSTWLKAAVVGWPSAAEYARQHELAREEDWR